VPGLNPSPAALFFVGAIHDWRGEALAIVLNLFAAAVQASDLGVVLLVPLDHNALFHLLQMGAIGILASGLRRGFGP
jgi:hypothetical protein